MKLNKYIRIIIISILSIHFIIIILSQINEQFKAESKLDIINEIDSYYVLPFFEQHWSMFAPNPPDGKRFIAVQFWNANGIKKDSTKILNIHESISQDNMRTYFSLNQRMIKYFAECFNDLSSHLSNKKLNREKLLNSAGLKSIKNYMVYVLKNQKEFLKLTQKGDSIYSTIYLVNEPLPGIREESISEKYYQKVDSILLVSK